MNAKKRYTIGVMVGGMHGTFPKEIISGIIAAGNELDVNVCLFLGTQTKGYFQDILLDEYKQDTYDYQFNTIYDYAQISGLDGLIISYGTLARYMGDVSPEDFAKKFFPIPTIFMSAVVDLPGCNSLISDNYQGICDVVEHLIRDHHCERILFMTGPRRNTDSEERKRAYLDVMERHSLPVTPEMIGEGDFTEFVNAEVEKLLDNNVAPQAIVFANDDMALAGYKVCARRGLVVGRDILITGFDDSDNAGSMNPPLTTVAQDGRAMARTALYDMLRILKNEKVDSRRIPVTFVQRESCGCAPAKESEKIPATDLAQEVHRLNRVIADMQMEFTSFQRKSWFIPIMTRELNDYLDDEKEFCLQIMERIRELRTKAAYLFLLDPPVVYDGESEWTCPETLRMASFYRNGRSVSYEPSDRPYVSAENSISKLVNDGDLHNFMTFLLFSGERQYGLLLCDIKSEDFSFFYFLSLQIGLSLRYLEISKIAAEHLRAMSNDMKKIQKENRALDIKSSYDRLTGLLNLHGLTDRITKVHQEVMTENAYMIYADLDHLKEINDTWGHIEGNFALQSISNILRSCLRDSDILARVGGDEFVSLVTSGSEMFEALFRERILAACRELNESSGKPYYVEISMGIVRFDLKPETDLQSIVAKADKQLYEDKKKRRPSIRNDMLPFR